MIYQKQAVQTVFFSNPLKHSPYHSVRGGHARGTVWTIGCIASGVVLWKHTVVYKNILLKGTVKPLVWGGLRSFRNWF